MGRKPGEPLVRLAEVEVVTEGDVGLEGFSGWSRRRFVDHFCRTMGVLEEVVVTRIEWRYL